jgi:hypothetical protein
MTPKRYSPSCCYQSDDLRRAAMPPSAGGKYKLPAWQGVTEVVSRTAACILGTPRCWTLVAGDGSSSPWASPAAPPHCELFLEPLHTLTVWRQVLRTRITTSWTEITPDLLMWPCTLTWYVPRVIYNYASWWNRLYSLTHQSVISLHARVIFY